MVIKEEEVHGACWQIKINIDASSYLLKDGFILLLNDFIENEFGDCLVPHPFEDFSHFYYSFKGAEYSALWVLACGVWQQSLIVAFHKPTCDKVNNSLKEKLNLFLMDLDLDLVF